MFKTLPSTKKKKTPKPNSLNKGEYTVRHSENDHLHILIVIANVSINIFNQHSINLWQLAYSFIITYKYIVVAKKYRNIYINYFYLIADIKLTMLNYVKCREIKACTLCNKIMIYTALLVINLAQL